MFNRIRCHFFGHRPRRHTVKKSQFSAWTVCGRCDQLMTRGYFGWQRANAMEERRFQRELARVIDGHSYGAGLDGTGIDMNNVLFPWVEDDGAERLTQPG